MTQDEAIKALDETIFNKPSGIPDDQLKIIVSQEIANHLVDFYNTTSNQWMLYKQKGDTFRWKGINCKVA